MKHLVIIDGYHFLFRAYHAVRPLNRSDGLHTNALFGFTQMLIKVVKDLEPDICAIALDTSPNFRHELYDQYKANRSEMDDEMKEQMPFVEPLIESFGIQPVRVKGFEADDVIATMSKKYGETHKVTIVSSDKDLLQLVGGSVQMYDSMKDKFMGSDETVEKFGVTPDKVTEVQALTGDASDNIPGVKGVGPKTAAQLIGEFESLDGVYANLENIKREKLKQTLVDCKEMAYLSHQLVSLRYDVSIECTESDLYFHPNISGAAQYLRDELEFNTLAARLEKGGSNTPPPQGSKRRESAETLEKQSQATPKKEVNYKTVDTVEKLNMWINKLEQVSVFAIDIETTGLNPMQAELVGISLAVTECEACYIPLTHVGDMLLGDIQQLPKETVFEALRPILLDDKIKKIGQNIKYDLHILAHEGLELNGVEDTMVMSFCLHGGMHNHGMDALAEKYLGHVCIPFKEVCGTGKKQITFDYVPVAEATVYAAEDADITLRLYNLFREKLSQPGNERVKKLYEEVERPLIPTLMRMEECGITVDRTALEKLSQEFSKRLKVHEAKIFEVAGTQFNVNSPKQMAEILFDQMGLKPKGKSRSTKVDVLERLAKEGHGIATEILAYRSLAKLMSTYSEALVRVINPKTGRVHTSYNQTGAATGRFSSSDPNLQNIPGRSEDGRKIRHCFVSKKGYQLLCADYSQIELRLLAHLSESEGLVDAFNQGHDIHRFTASQIFDVPQDEVTSEQRSASKAINFGLVYGMGEMSLSKQIGVTRQEAKIYIESYFDRYAGIRKYLQQYKEFVREKGYVETMYGRRVHVPAALSPMPMMKAAADRAAINAPLQGANADIIKMVMPQIEQALLDKDMKTKMLLQVHDELIFEVPDDEVDQAKELIQGMMSTVVEISVPLEVGVGVADNWEDAH